MVTSSIPMFVDINPQTGWPSPTTYESMLAELLEGLHCMEDLPDNVRRTLLAAADHFALAYEQANVGRSHLYASLTNGAYLKSVLALELMRRYRLHQGKRATLHQLIREGIEQGLIPGGKEYAPFWDGGREGRNQITHGDPVHPSYAPLAGSKQRTDHRNELVRGGDKPVHTITRQSDQLSAG
jgi:hypothetical protein